MKKATKKPEGQFPGLQEFMDRLPEIVALIKPEPPPLVPCTPYKPPPDRWVFGKHMAVNLTRLLNEANLVELCWESTYSRPRDPTLLVHRGDRYENIRIELGMTDSVVAALQEHFPGWPVFWPELPSRPETKSKRLVRKIRGTPGPQPNTTY